MHIAIFAGYREYRKPFPRIPKIINTRYLCKHFEQVFDYLFDFYRSIQTCISYGIPTQKDLSRLLKKPLIATKTLEVRKNAGDYLQAILIAVI